MKKYERKKPYIYIGILLLKKQVKSVVNFIS